MVPAFDGGDPPLHFDARQDHRTAKLILLAGPFWHKAISGILARTTTKQEASMAFARLTSLWPEKSNQ